MQADRPASGLKETRPFQFLFAMMKIVDTVSIIEKYYEPGSQSHYYLVEHGKAVANKALEIAARLSHMNPVSPQQRDRFSTSHSGVFCAARTGVPTRTNWSGQSFNASGKVKKDPWLPGRTGVADCRRSFWPHPPTRAPGRDSPSCPGAPTAAHVEANRDRDGRIQRTDPADPDSGHARKLRKAAEENITTTGGDQ